jgi:hypothetical protein
MARSAVRTSRSVETPRGNTDTFLTFPQLCERWGGVSHMFPERLLREDPRFPKIYRFGPNGRIRFVKLADVEAYERRNVIRERGAT